jgi:crotonobetainyl-CoA:carnitine CoA-transferase CaiB-like acyl-CoA transferase
VPVGSVVIDQHAAALYAMGIMAALLRRTATGNGGRVDVNLLQAAVDLQAESITAWLNGAPRTSPRGPGGVATWFSAGGYGIHQTKDGYLAISMSTPAELGKALGIASLVNIPEVDAFKRREEITQLVSAKVRTLSIAEAITLLDEAGIWNSKVEDYDALTSNPQLQHLGAFRTVESVTGTPVILLSHPVHYDGDVPDVRRAPQPLGAQTREVLSEVGFSSSEINDLMTRKVVSSAGEAA